MKTVKNKINTISMQYSKQQTHIEPGELNFKNILYILMLKT